VARIKIGRSTVALAIPVANGPAGIAITPNGKIAYVAQSLFSSSVTPLDIATQMPGTAITVGDGPRGVAVTPDQGPVAAFSATPEPVGVPTSFDASASSDPDGTVASYHWDFGDGSSRESTTSATITHIYTSRGPHTVTLAVSDTARCSTRVIFTGQTVGCNGSAAAQVSHPLIVP
jgi:PKD repeat protein